MKGLSTEEATANRQDERTKISEKVNIEEGKEIAVWKRIITICMYG